MRRAATRNKTLLFSVLVVVSVAALAVFRLAVVGAAAPDPNWRWQTVPADQVHRVPTGHDHHGHGRIAYRIDIEAEPERPLRAVRFAFVDALQAAKVDVIAHSPQGRIPLVHERRVRGKRVQVGVPRTVRPTALVVTVHHHLRDPAVLDHVDLARDAKDDH